MESDERWRQKVSAGIVSQVDQMIAAQRERVAQFEEGTRDHRVAKAILDDLRESLAMIETTPDPAELIKQLAEQIRNPKRRRCNLNDAFAIWMALALFSGCVGIYVEARCRPGTGGWEGFLHGALFGPVGWILLALYPNYPRKQ